jgi:hypothetical protein
VSCFENPTGQGVSWIGTLFAADEGSKQNNGVSSAINQTPKMFFKGPKGTDKTPSIFNGVLEMNFKTPKMFFRLLLLGNKPPSAFIGHLKIIFKTPLKIFEITSAIFQVTCVPDSRRMDRWHGRC